MQGNGTMSFARDGTGGITIMEKSSAPTLVRTDPIGNGTSIRGNASFYK